MKANAKYTIVEILTAAGIEKPAEVIGTIRVRVAGIPVNKNSVVSIQPGTKEVDVVVGQDKYVVKFDGDNKEKTMSVGAQEVLTAEGVETTKQVAEIQKAKAEAKKKPVK